MRLLVVDDHKGFREGLVRLLGSLADVEVLGEAASGEEGLVQAGRLQPDVVLMDLAMPGIGGVEATRRLRESAPHVGVVVLTMSDDDASVFAAVRSGARGYLLKGAPRTEVARAVEAVAAGEALFSAAVAARLVTYFTAAADTPTAEPFPELTDREREVLGLLSRGLPNARIAAELGVSPKTVRNHVSHVFAKLQVADRAQAVARARDAGLGGGGGPGRQTSRGACEDRNW
ncbi:response regulator [Kineococcus aurantiacus]|uniref:response regulator n=1 Tax=Kineococcus aurantiacus TaxID=37633 RepID=UPI0015CD9DC5